MQMLCLMAATVIFAATALGADGFESTAAGNVRALAGEWKPVKSSLHLLDSKLVRSSQTGFSIAIDKHLGDSHRKVSDTYYEQYTAYLTDKGQTPVGSGLIKFDHGAESEFIISTGEGSLYLWYGVVNGGNPRIFIGRGSDTATSTLVIEWNSSCSDSPACLNQDFATVIYERGATRPTRGHAKNAEND